jgi:hypothetical protein
MTKSELATIAKAVGAAIRPLRDRVAALEAQAKAWPGLKYRGPFRDGHEYVKGDIVSFQGGMWYCRASTAARPNDSQSDAWQLAVKSGRDARR